MHPLTVGCGVAALHGYRCLNLHALQVEKVMLSAGVFSEKNWHLPQKNLKNMIKVQGKDVNG